ncbi:phage tail protein [Citrobacter braakii]
MGTANGLGGHSIVLGDSDTGFKQEGDGILNVYANSAHVFRFISSLIESMKPLKVNGNCIATGEMQAGNGSARMSSDGNIYGSIWGNRWLLDYLVATFQPKGNFTPAGQAYTKAESDARYIQSMRLGSAISTTWWENGGDCPAGNILTGGDFNSDKSYVRYKPVQVLINGQWVTISG